MLLISELSKDRGLTLDAFSFKGIEIAAVEKTLAAARAEFVMKEVGADDLGRQGRRFTLLPAAVRTFERFLGVRFALRAGQTIVTAAAGAPLFRCDELTLDGRPGDCLNVAAPDLNSARVKCGLLASQQGWMGGEATPGGCSG